MTVCVQQLANRNNWILKCYQAFLKKSYPTGVSWLSCVDSYAHRYTGAHVGGSSRWTRNYAFDKNDGFMVDIISVKEDYVTLEFLGISGRSYIPFISNDLKKWRKVKFFTENSEIEVESIYTDEVEELKLNIPKKNLISDTRFFKLQVK